MVTQNLQYITLESKFDIGTLYNNYTHVSTDWEVATDKDFNNIIFQSLEDTNNKTKIIIDITNQPNLLFVRSRQHYDSFITPWSDIKVCYRGKWCILSPTIIDIIILGETDEIPKTAIFITSEFTPSITDDIHKATEWIILEKNTNKEIYRLRTDKYLRRLQLLPNILENGKEYILKVRYIGSVLNTKYYTKEFKVRNDSYIETPSIVMGDFTTAIEDVYFYGSNLESNDETLIHYATDWIIKDNLGNIIYQSLNDINNKTILKVPKDLLSINNFYTLEVTYKSNNIQSLTTVFEFNTVYNLTWKSISNDILITGEYKLIQTGNDTSILVGGYNRFYNDMPRLTQHIEINFNKASIKTNLITRTSYGLKYSSIEYNTSNNNFIYIGGENEFGELSNEIVSLTLDSSSYNVIATMSKKLKNVTSVNLGNSILILGGIDEFNKVSSDIYLLDLTNNNLTQVGNLPIPLYGLSATVTSLGLYIFGGRNNDIVEDNSYLMDLNSYSFTTLTTNERTKRYYSATKLLTNDRVLVCGGIDENDNILNSVYIYDVLNDTYTDLPRMLLGKYKHQLHVYNNGTNTFIVAISGFNIIDGVLTPLIEKKIGTFMLTI